MADASYMEHVEKQPMHYRVPCIGCPYIVPHEKLGPRYHRCAWFDNAKLPFGSRTESVVVTDKELNGPFIDNPRVYSCAARNSGD